MTLTYKEDKPRLRGAIRRSILVIHGSWEGIIVNYTVVSMRISKIYNTFFTRNYFQKYMEHTQKFFSKSILNGLTDIKQLTQVNLAG